MDSPRSGFRRAAATSWALTGVGIVGVAGASALSYVDTLEPVAVDTPTDVAGLAPQHPGSNPAPIVGVAPDGVTAVDPPLTSTQLTAPSYAPPIIRSRGS